MVRVYIGAEEKSLPSLLQEPIHSKRSRQIRGAVGSPKGTRVAGRQAPKTTKSGSCSRVERRSLARSREREQFWPGAVPGGGCDGSFSGETGRLVPSSQSSDFTEGRRLGGGSQCKQVQGARLLKLDDSLEGDARCA